MEKMSKITKQTFTMLMAMLLTFGTIVPVSFMTAPEVDAATVVSYKQGMSDDYRKFTVTSGTAKGATGYCGDIFHKAPDKTGKASIKQLDSDDKAARVMYYYLIKKGWASKTQTKSSGWGSWSYGRAMDTVENCSEPCTAVWTAQEQQLPAHTSVHSPLFMCLQFPTVSTAPTAAVPATLGAMMINLEACDSVKRIYSRALLL